MVKVASPFLGKGLYTPAEAARYARVTTQLLSRWVHGSKAGRAVIHAQYANDSEKSISFLDFVQTLGVRNVVRQPERPSLKKVREAIDRVRAEFGVEYPFAQRHRVIFHAREIWVKLPPQPETDDLYTQVTGTRGRRQTMMRNVVQLYLRDLDFSVSGEASRYRIFSYNNLDIWMDPHKRFGEPLLPSGITPQTISQAVRTEGSDFAAAEAYGIQVEEVELALRFEDFLDSRVAA
jgi:hypothetical protein